MNYVEKWIWLPKEKYPNMQTTKYSHFSESGYNNYAVAEFKKTYSFDKKIDRVNLRFSGDTEFQLFLNGEILATGPAAVGGDWIGNDRMRSNFYSMQTCVYPDSNELDFFARVKMMPVKMCDYSKGHGGFMLTAQIIFEDGTKKIVSSDETWQVRYNGRYNKPYSYDASILPDEYVFADVLDDIWKTSVAPLKIREEKEVFPIGENTVTVKAGEEKEAIFELDMIHAGFIHLSVKTKGQLFAEVYCKEIDEAGSCESFVFEQDDEYRGLELHSAGKIVLKVKNNSDSDAKVEIGFITTYYPVYQAAKTTTDDEEINKILEVCTHTLKYCRQLHHLDSPRHCEPLACTGDYYIESLMTAFSFGDMSLAEFDLIRTAGLLRDNDGRIFHTTYSLIWVRMLYDVYMFTGNKELLENCEDALLMLLNRFETYLDNTGVIENPPDYMFIDWIYIDGFSLHHPPKALGQTSLNMFYFGALDYASKIFDVLGEKTMSCECVSKKEALRKAINSIFYDTEKGLYFEGRNTKTTDEYLYQFMPQNTDKRYYLKHSNILAAYFGVCDYDTSKMLIEKIMTDECPGEVQPYFAHYLFEAIYENGLRDKYALKLLENWKPSVKECPKGLAEGFIKLEPTYVFDHSHAWGGTPLYSLAKAVLGFKIIKAGMLELELSPSLIGLKEVRVELPTEYGMVSCEIKENKEPVITAPKEVKIRIK